MDKMNLKNNGRIYSKIRKNMVGRLQKMDKRRLSSVNEQPGKSQRRETYHDQMKDCWKTDSVKSTL